MNTKPSLLKKKLLELPSETIDQLEKKAKADKRNIKNYMEKVLIEHAANPLKK